MSKKLFTDEEVNILSKNKYVKNVTNMYTKINILDSENRIIRHLNTFINF